MEQKLKQRLIGAIVLISLAVIFIPIILEGPDHEWTPRSHSIPEPPQMDYGARLELPMPVEETASVKPAAIPPLAEVEVEAEAEAEAETESEREAKAAVAAAVAAEQTEPPATPAVAVSTKPVVADTPPQQAENKTADPPAVASQPDRSTKLPDNGWVIQVGSFSSERNANSLRDRLRISGYDSLLQDVAVGQGRMYRVVVGPLQERKAAEQLRKKLENEMQLRGIVLENKG